VALARGDFDDLTGRYLRAVEDLSDLAADRAGIVARNARVLRLTI
jgi:hypothetical protein